MVTQLYMYEAGDMSQDWLVGTLRFFLDAEVEGLAEGAVVHREDSEAQLSWLSGDASPFGCPAIAIGVTAYEPPSVCLAWEALNAFLVERPARVWLAESTWSRAYLAEKGIAARPSGRGAVLSGDDLDLL